MTPQLMQLWAELELLEADRSEEEGAGIQMEKCIANTCHPHQALLISLHNGSCTILFSSHPSDQTFQSNHSEHYSIVFFALIYYFVFLFTCLSFPVSFSAHCLGCTISAPFSSNSPPISKVLVFQADFVIRNFVPRY